MDNDRDSDVLLDLKHSFESTDSEISFTKPLELFPPDEWPHALIAAID